MSFKLFILLIIVFTTATYLNAETLDKPTFPSVGSSAPNFTLINANLREVNLSDFKGSYLIMNIFPSVDTAVCASSVREFNQRVEAMEGVKTLAVSNDLPFALARYCATEGLDNTIPLSGFRNPEFGEDYRVAINSGMLKGLLARAVIVIDKEGKVIYTEFVEKISDEPDYDKALAAIKEQ